MCVANGTCCEESSKFDSVVRLCVANGTCCEESSKLDSVVDCVLPMGLVVKRAPSMTATKHPLSVSIFAYSVNLKINNLQGSKKAQNLHKSC